MILARMRMYCSFLVQMYRIWYWILFIALHVYVRSKSISVSFTVRSEFFNMAAFNNYKWRRLQAQYSISYYSFHRHVTDKKDEDYQLLSRTNSSKASSVTLFSSHMHLPGSSLSCGLIFVPPRIILLVPLKQFIKTQQHDKISKHWCKVCDALNELFII